MYDIHCHILPGIDDGPQDIDEALQMVCVAEKAGLTGIVCTPHYIEGRYDHNSSHNLAALDSLKMLIEQMGIKMKVFAGNEVLITPNIINLLEEQKIVTINKSRYILIEMPFSCKPLFADDVIFRLRLKGLVPIIAHPERYEWIMTNPKNIVDLINKGCLAQLNLPSLNGYYGEQVKKTAKKLLKERLIHVLGSDSHSADNTYKQFTRSMDILKSVVSSDVVEQLINNTKAVIEDKEIRTFA